jgi:hypothetical protein
VPMKNPPLPGGFVRRECIEPLGLTNHEVGNGGHLDGLPTVKWRVFGEPTVARW